MPSFGNTPFDIGFHTVYAGEGLPVRESRQGNEFEIQKNATRAIRLGWRLRKREAGNKIGMPKRPTVEMGGAGTKGGAY